MERLMSTPTVVRGKSLSCFFEKLEKGGAFGLTDRGNGRRGEEPRLV